VAVGRTQQQLALLAALDREAAVALDGLAQIRRDRGRHGEARVAVEGREHVVRRMPGGARVPQPEARDAIRVDVLGGALELGEDGEVAPRRMPAGARERAEARAV